MAAIESTQLAHEDKRTNPNSLQIDAFLCHVSRLDGVLASRLKDGLEKLGREKTKAFALKVFLDQHSVGAGELPLQIQRAIDATRFLIVLIRPELQSRPWCVDEITRWLSINKQPKCLLLVLTQGSDLRFENGILQFSNPFEFLPQVLASAFDAEPSWIDLRAVPNARNDDWWMRLGKLASPIHGIEPEKLWSRQIAQQRRALNLARATILSLTVMAFGLTYWVWQATLARNLAQTQTRASTQRGLAAQAMLALNADPVAASKLTLDAHVADPAHSLPELKAALTEVLHQARLVRRLEPPMGTFGQIRALVWSVDNEHLLVASDGAALVLNRNGFAISNPITLAGKALSANAACALRSGGFVIAYGHRMQSSSAPSGLLWLDKNGLSWRNSSLPDEALSVACEEDEVAVGTDRGRVYRASLALPDLIEDRAIEGEPPVNAVIWANSEPLPVAGTASRGSGGMPVVLGTSDPPMMIDILAQPSNVLAAVPFGLGFALATQSGSIQLLEENLSGTGWIADPNVAFNGHVGPVWALQSVDQTLISAGADSRVRVWRENGSAQFTLVGHRAPATALAWDTRENQLYSGDLMGGVLVWDLPELADAQADSAPLAWNHLLSRFVERSSISLTKGQHLPTPGDFFERLVINGNDVYWLDGTPHALHPLRTSKLSDPKLRPIKLPNDLPTAVLPMANAGLLIGGGYANGMMGLKSTEAAFKAMREDMPELTLKGFNEHALGLYLFERGALRYSTKAVHTDSVLALAASGGKGHVRYASGGADGRVALWSESLQRISNLSLLSDVESTVVTALQFSQDGTQLIVGIKTEAMNLGSERGWLLGFDVASGDLVWRQDLVRETPVALLTAGSNLFVIQTRRSTSPTDMTTVEKLFLIQSNGLGLSTLTADLTDTLVAVGVDERLGVLHVADAEGRRLSYDVTVAAQIKRLAARHAFHHAHTSALEQVTRAERALAQHNRGAAIAAFRAALINEPRSAEIRMRLAGQLMQDFKTLDESISLYSSVILDMPRMSLPRYQRGRALLFAKRFAQAEADFTVALTAGSEVFTPVRKIESPGAIGELNDAVREANAKFAIGPRLELLELRAIARQQQGNCADALKDAKAAQAGGRKTDRSKAIVSACPAEAEQ